MVTTATSGMRIPSCGLMIAAMTVKIAARSGRSRHSSRRPSSRNTTPNESTWPQTTLSNQLIGLRTATNAAAEREAVAAAELEDHRPDQPADGQVGQDRRDLDQRRRRRRRRCPTMPDQPQDVQVARACSRGRSRGRRSRRGPFAGEVARPEPERAQVDPEAGPREQVCDDEAEGETEREDHEDRADGSLRPGRPRRRSCASLGPAGGGASHRERLLHERGRWIGA